MNNEEVVNKSILSIPILNGYKLLDIKTGALFVAKSDDGSVEQYIEEGKLGAEETFDERLKNVLTTTKSILETKYEKKDIIHLQDYNTDILSFTLYLQDNTKGIKTIRQINAYFKEPKTNYFYEITLSAPPLLTMDLNDNVTNNIYNRLLIILNNIKYNE